MKKLLILISVAIIASLIFLSFKQFFNKNSKRELITELTPLLCDLNKNPCYADYKGKKIEFSFEPRPLKILKETKVLIKNLDNIKELNARLYGLNMYMGDIVNDFEKIGNDYVGKIVFSSCIESTMRYRFELFSKDESLGIYVDFDVVR